MKLKRSGFSFKQLLHPCFDFRQDLPCPYIWFAYWLITWDRNPDDSVKVTSIRISFMPD